MVVEKIPHGAIIALIDAINRIKTPDGLIAAADIVASMAERSSAKELDPVITMIIRGFWKAGLSEREEFEDFRRRVNTLIAAETVTRVLPPIEYPNAQAIETQARALFDGGVPTRR